MCTKYILVAPINKSEILFLRTGLDKRVLKGTIIGTNNLGLSIAREFREEDMKIMTHDNQFVQVQKGIVAGLVKDEEDKLWFTTYAHQERKFTKVTLVDDV